jgi:hypothetical protein
MNDLQRRIVAVNDATAQLVAQLRELDQLREQVKKAQLSADRRQSPRRFNGKRNGLRTALRISLIRPGCEPALAETDVAANREAQPTIVGWRRRQSQDLA